MVLNITPIKVYVKKEALYNYDPTKTGYLEGWWHSIKCVGGKPFICEVYFPQNGASYDKLTLSDLFHELTDSDKYSLDILQLWDVFSDNAFLFEKKFFNESTVKVLLKTKKVVQGTYMFTVDWTGYLADVFEEHKSANFILLDNGQIAAQPNNRVRFLLPSLISEDYNKERIDWQPRRQIQSVERNPKWKLGNTETWTYED
jgi:hypothetical protein